MGKSKKESQAADKLHVVSKTQQRSAIAVDPTLAALFNSSAPRAPPSITRSSERKGKINAEEVEVDDEEILSERSEILDDEAPVATESETVDVEQAAALPKGKKRKRGQQDEDIEGRYLQRLAQENAKEIAARKKANRNATQQAEEGASSHEEGSNESDANESDSDDASVIGEDDADDTRYKIPQHESLNTNGTESELGKAARTVFLGNVSTEAIKSKSSEKILLKHLSSFFPDMKDSNDQSVESIRYRSTAFSDGSLPKKAAFVKKELMDATTKSTNAYAIYSTPAAAREAVKKLNATVVLERHLRVDSVAHPSAVDHRRCVFVGNLGFVDDESNIRANEADEGQRPRAKVAADVEEGLWVHFGKVGAVESVRVVRDRGTRVGKGFAYVQFEDPNSVEKALAFNEKKFPPMLPRKLRIVRARKVKKATVNKSKSNGQTKGIYQPKPSAQLSSLAGRASKLLGRAGGYHVRKSAKQADIAFKSPEDVIFEGHRAVPGSGPKMDKNHKRSKRPPRRTNRSTAYRARSGKT